MDIKDVKFYVRQLRYFYQEIFIFFAALLLILLPLGFSSTDKVAVVMFGWGVSLIVRSLYFNFPSLVIEKLQAFSRQWEEKKINLMTEKSEESQKQKEKSDD